MKTTFTILFLLFAASSFSQVEPDGPYMGQKSNITTLLPDDSTISPIGKRRSIKESLLSFNAGQTTGLVMNIAGTCTMLAGFTMQPRNEKQLKSVRTYIQVGAAINIIGLAVQVISLDHMKNAATKIGSQELSLLVNENGLGLKFTMP